MKKVKIIGIAGAIILIIGGFLPLAILNSKLITIFPVYDNFNIAKDTWAWRNVSAFAITYFICSILIVIFLQKLWYIGVLICDSLLGFSVFIMLAATWYAQHVSSQYIDMTFSWSYGWILVFLGVAAIFYAGLKQRLLKLTEKKEN